MFEILKEIICEYVEVDPDDIKEDSSLRYDLGATSFDLMNIAGAVEERFELSVTDNSLKKIKTVGDIAELLAEKVK
ncbi:MAG: acyl carrier protein [Ruminococcaceae bacterium]|nr:acyl carrier protein [Oscillospiraceae bacterium]